MGTKYQRKWHNNEKRSKNVNLLLVGIGIILVLSISVLVNQSKAAEKSNVNETESLSNLLTTYNITVAGSNSELTHFQLSGLLDLIDSEYSAVLAKYDEKLSKMKGNIKITPEEILELDYYSMTPEEQEAFLLKAKNQKVNISSKDGALLISYNVNVDDTVEASELLEK